MKTVNFKPLRDTSIHYKGKYIRFAGVFPVSQTTHDGKKFLLQPGVIGICYVANGATLHVVFQCMDSNVLPDKDSMRIAIWPYHIGILPHIQSCWEIES